MEENKKEEKRQKSEIIYEPVLRTKRLVLRPLRGGDA